MQKPFVVHEWGTFLAIAGSDGVNLEGMYHEEHPLPEFVYAQKEEDTTFKKIATLKGETPVIYFYTDKPRRVRVSVDFPTGIWTHWFPSAVRSGRFLGANPNANGHLGWVARITPPSAQDRLPAIAPNSLWRFARAVPQAATVQMTETATLVDNQFRTMSVAGSGESERFLFYRGLGKADLPVRFLPEVEGGQLIATVPLRHVIVVKVSKGQISWRAFDSLAPRQKLSGITQRLKPGTAPAIAARLTQGLIASGLFPDEARALVNTWKSSYFDHDGLRVLFVLPQSWTDAFIPIRVSPIPDALVRVMVGRIEGLTLEREAAVADALQRYATAPEKHFATLAAQGRYLEPILRRLSARPMLRSLCEKLLATAFVATGNGNASQLQEILAAP